MTYRTKIVSFLKNFGQSILSLSFNLLGLLTGTVLVLNQNVFSYAPWILPLFPSILSIRGAIGGIFCAQMGTALHVGTISPKFKKNTVQFYHLFHSVVVLTFISSITAGFTFYLFNTLILRVANIDSVAIMIVVISTMGFSILFITPIALLISIIAFKKGLDPDVITYPIISTIADVIVMLCYVLMLNLYFSMDSQSHYVLLLIDLLFLTISMFYLSKDLHAPYFIKTIREFLITLGLISVIMNITGLILTEIMGVVGNQPQIFVIYPALMTTIGGLGSIIGSTATTKLALGSMTSSFSSIKEHLTEILSTWIASLILFIVFPSVIFIFGVIDLQVFRQLVLQLLFANILAASIMIIISFGVAIATYKRGWDPDNFVIPIESSIADAVTTTALLIVMSTII